MSVKKGLFFILVLCLFSAGLFAHKSITTEGIGKTEAQARTYALQELSRTICTVVESTTQAAQEMKAKSGKRTKTIQSIEMKVLITSDMPLYGVTFETSNNGLKGKNAEYKVKATIDAKNAVPLYQNEIQKIVEVINPRVDALSGAKEKDWQTLAANYATFDKLEMILEVFESSSPVQPKMLSGEFRNRYEQYASKNTSIEKAAAKIVEGIGNHAKNHLIYVYPPVYEGENTTTEFSNVLSSAVKTKLGSSLTFDRDKADSYLKGSYYFAPGAVDGEDLIVSYYLCKSDGAVLASSGLVKIPYEVYGPYKYLPRNYDLQAEIAAGRVNNPEFDISIRINGDRNLQDFATGDSLIIEARANSPCYIYLLSYVYNDNGEPFTYLFPLNPYGEGKEMFARKISTKEINRWFVINPVIDNDVLNIEVIPPYGEETLHIFASTTDDFDEFLDSIPSYIETDDFYLVSGNPLQNVSKTRALNVKRVSTKASKVVNTAENIISFTTHK